MRAPGTQIYSLCQSRPLPTKTPTLTSHFITLATSSPCAASPTPPAHLLSLTTHHPQGPLTIPRTQGAHPSFRASELLPEGSRGTLVPNLPNLTHTHTILYHTILLSGPNAHHKWKLFCLSLPAYCLPLHSQRTLPVRSQDLFSSPLDCILSDWKSMLHFMGT